MKRYCIGLFFIVFIALTVVPAFHIYAVTNMANSDILIKPGWFYGLVLITSLVSAFICEMTTTLRVKKI